MGDDCCRKMVSSVGEPRFDQSKLQEAIFCGVDRRGAGLIGGIDRGEIAMGLVSGERGVWRRIYRGVCV